MLAASGAGVTTGATAAAGATGVAGAVEVTGVTAVGCTLVEAGVTAALSAHTGLSTLAKIVSKVICFIVFITWSLDNKKSVDMHFGHILYKNLYLNGTIIILVHVRLSVQ